VVDVGGGLGASSVPLARDCPNVELVVQDEEDVVTEAKEVIDIHSHLPFTADNIPSFGT
jgi:O-methyltransferase domain